MGFEGLLWLRERVLPRNLCYWLMTRVNPVRKVLMLPGGTDYPIHKTQVHWVLGIPATGKSVPKKAVNNKMLDRVNVIVEKYGVDDFSGFYKEILLGNVRNLIEVEWDVDGESDFKTTFLIMVLGDVLCPSTSAKLSSNLVPAITVALESCKYDWAQLVLDKLFICVKNFAKRFYRDGYARGCGGCTYFLAIMYLDRLKQVPAEWGVFPRIRVWTIKLVNAAKKEDRFDNDGDYGKVGCVDVAYGEHIPTWLGIQWDLNQWLVRSPTLFYNKWEWEMVAVVVKLLWTCKSLTKKKRIDQSEGVRGQLIN